MTWHCNSAPQYVDAFRQLAKKSNTVLLPSNTGDPAAMIAQARAQSHCMHRR